MTEYKKLITGFGYQGGKATTWDGKETYTAGLSELVRKCCDNGADQVLIVDYSTGDAEHEAAIAAIKDAARAVEAPIIAGGRVRRLEDVKKYLYAGASTVFMDMSREDNRALIKEAADRFGKEKLLAFYPEKAAFAAIDDVEMCFACCGKDELENVLSSGKLHGAVVTLHEAEMDLPMELKQRLKAAGIPTDTFESTVKWSDFKLNSDGLIPVIVQDYKTHEVLMMAYMNEEAFEATLRGGRMTYYSRSRECLWLKGETSGHFQYVKSLKIDCDNDTILATVKQIGAACHTGNRSCFFTTLAEKEYKATNPLEVFEHEYQVIVDRKEHPKEGSYTNYLFDKGIDKILKKLGEEATEIVIAAKNPDPEEVKYEISDFLYHMMVLMVEKGVTWEEIIEEVANR
jgi:phosphoribosyl-ATP pyrophosphohydrolase/phosphoribosyl-AMP cyclohydrolase